MDGMTRLPKRPVAGPRLGGSPITSTTGYPWADGDILYAADLNAAFAMVGANVSQDIGRNLLHNPLFRVAQRSVGPWTTSQYTFDRWQAVIATDTVSITLQNATDADRAGIGDEAALYFFDNVFTGNAAAGAFNYVRQPIEGVRRTSGKTITVSLWAKAQSAGLKLGISCQQYFGAGGSPSATVIGIGAANVALSTAWARYSATIALPSTSGKTTGTDGTDQLDVDFWFSSGATNNAQAGNIGVQSGTIQLWGVQLEIGSVATPLEKPDPRYDLANCQRFYAIGSGHAIMNAAAAGYYIAASACLPVQMRAVPTLNGPFNIAGAPTNCGAITADTANTQSFRIIATSVAGGLAAFDVMFSASADL